MVAYKISVLALLVASALAAPQLSVNLEEEEPFNTNPQYTYAYQVADDNEQTYIAHQEERDGADVSGEYSYVDPLGNLIVVKYTAGVMGYTETREVQPNFVEIRRKATTTQVTSAIPAAPVRPAVPARPVAPVAPVRQVVQQVRPIVQQVVQEQTSSSSSSSNDSDLVARIIAQLTPFIRTTVSSSLGSSSGSSSASTGSNSGSSQVTTTTTTSSRRPAAPVRRVIVPATPVRRVIVPATPVAAPQPAVTREVVTSTSTSEGSISNIFGVQGENNVRVNTPDFNFAYDLSQ